MPKINSEIWASENIWGMNGDKGTLIDNFSQQRISILDSMGSTLPTHSWL
jgi:hypothetical protein